MTPTPTADSTAEAPPKKRPDRKKAATPDSAPQPSSDSAAAPVKRKPGRPRKSESPTTPQAEATAVGTPNVIKPSRPGKTTRSTPPAAPPVEPTAPPPPVSHDSRPANQEAHPGHGQHQNERPAHQNEHGTNQNHGGDSHQGGQGHKQFRSRRFFKRGRFKPHKNRQGGQGGSEGGQGYDFSDGRSEPRRSYPAARSDQAPHDFDPQDDPPSDQPVETFPCEGVLELSGKGFGFLRERGRAYQQHPQDVFVTPEIVRRHGLRDGMMVAGTYRRSGRGPQMVALETINGGEPERFKIAPLFEELTALNPEKRIRLETHPDRHTTRVIDLIAPIGMGQRGLIVAPPRTGKTTLLMHIAEAVIANHPEVHLLVLLVDERPEEVTEFKINLPQAELWASSNDSDVKSHTRIAQLCLDRAKRMVEDGKDVFLILDSITRVGRAFNNAMQGTGRTLTGGMDVRGMEIPRRLFAAARNTEEAGSLTIVATALIETGSRMDELIFQEFKGTGNMELVLDRRIAEQRIYPAVDIFKSGTRREELLVPEEQLRKISVIRRGLAGHKPVEAIDRLLFFIRKFPTNTAMLEGIPG